MRVKFIKMPISHLTFFFDIGILIRLLKINSELKMNTKGTLSSVLVVFP